MALLNNTNYPYIHSQLPSQNSPASAIHYRKTSFVWELRDFDDGNDYWYCEIFHGNAFEVYDIRSLIPASILEKIRKDNKTFMYICNSHEAFLDIVKLLYESLVFKEKIPPNKIIIANEAADLDKEVKRFADLHKVGYMQVEWILEFEAATASEAINHALTETESLDEHKIYNKRFLNFNRRWRIHRPTVVALLKAIGILDKGHVSLGDSDDNQKWQNVYEYIKWYNSSNEEITRLLDSVEQEILNMPPLYLDFTDLKTNRASIEPESDYLYKDTVFSLVSETTFYTNTWFNDARFLSEKTFKPVIYGHPFIMISVPKSLELFRSLGYKSFHPFIDESYDTELNDCERLLKIVKETKRIVQMTDSEISEFIRNVKPIVEFNKITLMNKIGDRSPSFMKNNFKHKKI